MKVVDIRGLRHGVGATFVAASLAYLLSEGSEAAEPVNVLAVDATEHLFGLKSCFGEPSLTDKNYPFAYTSRLQCYSYPRNLNESFEAKRATINTVLNNAALKDVDIVVVDSGSVEESAALNIYADFTVTVTEADCNCLMQAALTHRFGKKEYLLVNKIWPMSRSQSDIVMYLRYRPELADRILANSVPFDEFILQSALNKKTAAELYPLSQSTDQIRKLADRLAADLLGASRG